MSSVVQSIGVYGGSFDPIHFGHLRSALEVKHRLGLDQLRFIPSGNPPHRAAANVASEHRLAMLELAIAATPGLVIDAREIESQKTSYSFDTLQSVQAEEPQACLVLIIGTDQFSAFDSWHRWQDLLESVHVAVMERPGELLSEAAKEILAGHQSGSANKPGVSMCPVTQLDISSTRIRGELQQGTDIQFLVPYAVREYINTHRLYT